MAEKTEYKNHWQKENVDRINLTTPKGKKEISKAHAEARRESVNGFINRAIGRDHGAGSGRFRGRRRGHARQRLSPGRRVRPGLLAVLIRAACREPEKGRWNK